MKMYGVEVSGEEMSGVEMSGYRHSHPVHVVAGHTK